MWKKAVAIAVVAGLAVPGLGGADEDARENADRSRSALLGAIVGGIAGVTLGGWGALHIAENEETFVLLWTAFAVGGAFAGYAAGGGYSKDDVEQALERDRREIEAARVRRDAAVKGLRLSALAGFAGADSHGEPGGGLLRREVEGAPVSRADAGEMPAIGGGDGRGPETLGHGDHRGVDEADLRMTLEDGSGAPEVGVARWLHGDLAGAQRRDEPPLGAEPRRW